MSNSYSNDSIESLGILGGVRAKPASLGIESQNHTFIEILANSIDEVNAGYGNEIIVSKNEDGSVTVRDFGRGVPMDKNSNGEYAYKKIFDEFFAGGKYNNNNNDGGNYKYSLGTNGLGACATNYTSDFFEAFSFKDNVIMSVRYEEGLEVEDSFKKEDNFAKTPRGTSITWLPSAECFRGKGEIDDDFIINTLKDQSIVNGGLKFTFVNYKTNETKEFYYENGVTDYIKSISSEEHSLTDVISFTTEQKGRDNENDKDYRIKAEVYFAFNRESSFSRYYHNSSWLENGGTPEDFIKNSFTYVIDKLIKEQGGYKKNEKKVSFEDVSDSLVIVSSTYSTISLFTDQTKKKIGSEFMKKAFTEWLREQLEVYFIENPVEAKKVAEQAMVNKRSREKAESTRLNVKKKLQGGVSNLTNRIDSFVNCRSKDPNETEVCIVEGKSALGSTKQGRDSNTQAIYAIRGKILNCLKADYDKIFKNDVVIELMKILGCGVEIKSKHNKELSNFDINNLRWNKVIIITDQDVDGQHIRTLALTMLYRLTPQLIEQGKVFIAESPLYEIDGDGKTFFAYSDKERDEILSKVSKNVRIQRSKGLGENTAEMMWETTMNPETRRLTQVKAEDVERMNEYFELFLGENLENRKKYIADNLHHYVEEVL